MDVTRASVCRRKAHPGSVAADQARQPERPHRLCICGEFKRRERLRAAVARKPKREPRQVPALRRTRRCVVTIPCTDDVPNLGAAAEAALRWRRKERLRA